MTPMVDGHSERSAPRMTLAMRDDENRLTRCTRIRRAGLQEELNQGGELTMNLADEGSSAGIEGGRSGVNQQQR